MVRAAYFDLFSGCSGDMIIGSLLDAGLDLEVLKKGLGSLDFSGYKLTSAKVVRSSITATKFDVILGDVEPAHEHHHEHEHSHDHPHEHEHTHEHTHEPEPAHTYETASHAHRGLTEILRIIDSGDLSANVKTKSSAIFRKLGMVEAGIHGVPLEEVHFHELGAIDTIVDIVGTVLALETLKIEKVYASPLATGSGTVKTAHGILPVPAPATLQILADAGAPLVAAPPSDTPPGELLTPTGAVLITSLAAGYNRPNLKVDKVGYGAGYKQFPGWPNVVRVWIGEIPDVAENAEMVLLETNIDDMNPQIYGYLMEILLGAKAADVWFTPIQMKKNRPAIMLSVLGPAALEEKFTEIIMRETSTLGVRSRPIGRHTAHREIFEFTSSLGLAHVKVKRYGDFLSVSPEFDDCRRIALEKSLPLQEVSRIIENEARLKL
jgi:pyridinium-3,5-bisthiocarboxylic acid mononucleotide nickel chelatase